MQTVVTADTLLSPGQRIEKPIVVIEDGRIADVTSQTSKAIPAGNHLDFSGHTLVPAYFDVHIHGSGGFDVMDATETSLSSIGKFLAKYGVGAYLATTVTAPMDSTLKSLEGLAKLMNNGVDGAQPLGIHIEGPFLSPHKKGAHPANLLLTPTVELFDRMWQAADGKIRLMTIAPELPNAEEVIAHAVKFGVRVSMGHSDANAEAAKRGLRAGATTATHTYNAMRRFDHRDPGLLGEVLANDDLFAELICDGLHVHPAAVEVFWKAKGPERAILITDAMSATGMPDGNYKLGELDVRVKNGKCIIGEDTLAGSTLTLDRAVKNFSEFTGADLGAVTMLASRNPARMAGFDEQIGTLETGRSANITVLSDRKEVVETILQGQLSSKL